MNAFAAQPSTPQDAGLNDGAAVEDQAAAAAGTEATAAAAVEETADVKVTDEERVGTLDVSQVVFGGSHALRVPHPDGGFLGIGWNGLAKRLHG